MSHSKDWSHASHAVHVVKDALETEHGKQATQAVLGTAVAVATAVPVLLPLVAVSGLIWWLAKK